MSAELIILPLALAAVLAIRATQNSTRVGDGQSGVVYAWRVQSAMTDRQLLQAACTQLGLSVTWSGDVARLEHQGWHLGLVKDGEAFVALFESGTTEQEALDFTSALEVAYRKCVQAAVITRIQVDAAQSGFDVLSQQRNANESVTLTLKVRPS